MGDWPPQVRTNPAFIVQNSSFWAFFGIKFGRSRRFVEELQSLRSEIDSGQLGAPHVKVRSLRNHDFVLTNVGFSIEKVWISEAC